MSSSLSWQCLEAGCSVPDARSGWAPVHSVSLSLNPCTGPGAQYLSTGDGVGPALCVSGVAKRAEGGGRRRRRREHTPRRSHAVELGDASRLENALAPLLASKQAVWRTSVLA
ncbi:uncharacterized protein SPSK_04676 [Sporothrix schenckii 1099-18]|uniref:Uncharacterized protein n=1 Tax=Sporothrix schenckii 1099-18 TaxID=1397361 RepID=A0A0F2M273_SPOSC|nr:uncharacterized protein SPSK_04676 [Sporothrix schenckii 1099-18]KJR83807.1 hypothetical protein SPSK_04676 [Sporothrix schenckii 1099-18]